MPTEQSYFVVVYRPASRYPQGTREEVTEALAALPEMKAHMTYLGNALDRGDIELGAALETFDHDRGPSGGVLIYRGMEASAVKAFVDADPMVRAGYEQAEIFHGHILLRGEKVR
ncbi:hypothetical protein P5Y53_13655 [Dyella jiangningensis]|uniref:YciI family protein n=1 Tax=Dyella jiangningensis TaxID=1379159 RepID=UPI00240FA624|nr:hypothetical protein [Dyella jiangningensis]MDG2538715.1 hypothetical protein [Dyella jiangningensis]